MDIKGIPENETPYTRFEKYGEEALTDAELLAVIIKTGHKGKNVVDVCRQLLSKASPGEGISFLRRLTFGQLTEIKGIGRVKALQIKSVCELARRMSFKSPAKKFPVRSSYDAYKLVEAEFLYKTKEILLCILLDFKGYPIDIVKVSAGGRDSVSAYSRDVFREAVGYGSSGVILAHNHPGGGTEPTGDDIKTTRYLSLAGDILGIKVADHLIITEEGYYSFTDDKFVYI